MRIEGKGKTMKIILDAMGGDNAPAAILQGAAQAVTELGVQILAVGDQKAIYASAAEHGISMEGIEVLHHSEYIERLISTGKLQLHPSKEVFTYHDPCELGRGSGIYEAPRQVIEAIGELREVAENREHALCCGSSLGNTAISDEGQLRIAESVADTFAATGANSVVTACPLCKKAIARSNKLPVYDSAEVVAGALQPNSQVS